MNSSPVKGVILGFTTLFSITLIGTIGYMMIEGWSFLDSFYMTLITVSTIGYGETHKLTEAGRVFTSLFIMAGLGASLYTFSKMGQIIFEGELLKFIGERKMKNEVEKLNDHYIICGFGRIGETVAKGLTEKNKDFVVIDNLPEKVTEVKAKGYKFISGDATDEDTLKSAGIDRASTLLSMLPTDADNLYLVISARELRKDLKIIAKAMDSKAERRLIQGGATHVVSPYTIASYHMLHAAISPNILKYLELGTHKGDTVSLQEIRVKKNSQLAGTTIVDSNIRREFDVAIVAIKRYNDELIINPSASEVLQENDILVTSGTDKALANFARNC